VFFYYHVSFKFIVEFSILVGKQQGLARWGIALVGDLRTFAVVSMHKYQCSFIACAGDDVAVAICPRIAYNVDGDCDIFDHQKVAYCERMQLGMDAYGFTACMHTNMLLRARALQEIGWFPSHTSSENWELGMLLVRPL
jgi:hypothetical protein